jgi:hypothetical protein
MAQSLNNAFRISYQKIVNRKLYGKNYWN